MFLILTTIIRSLTACASTITQPEAFRCVVLTSIPTVSPPLASLITWCNSACNAGLAPDPNNESDSCRTFLCNNLGPNQLLHRNVQRCCNESVLRPQAFSTILTSNQIVRIRTCMLLMGQVTRQLSRAPSTFQVDYTITFCPLKERQCIIDSARSYFGVGRPAKDVDLVSLINVFRAGARDGLILLFITVRPY
ncbi:hypothetical protein EI94DRAFT_1734618 [Lactarius quietus]|nr:hypothetical protein EI94DRAFT_1734618 [Lactarius quietus]